MLLYTSGVRYGFGFKSKAIRQWQFFKSGDRYGFFQPLDIFGSGFLRKRQDYVLRKYYIINLKNLCISPSIKIFTLNS